MFGWKLKHVESLCHRNSWRDHLCQIKMKFHLERMKRAAALSSDSVGFARQNLNPSKNPSSMAAPREEKIDQEREVEGEEIERGKEGLP